MDADTKQTLKLICAVLRDTTEQAYRVHEMAERIHIACLHMVPDFRNCYESPVQPELRHIADSKKNLISRIDGVILALQKPRPLPPCNGFHGMPLSLWLAVYIIASTSNSFH